MNLFILFLCPKLAAAAYNNKHLVKIILECSSMLSVAWFALDKKLFEKASLELVQKGSVPLPRVTHLNNPITKWVRETAQNYGWASEHLKALYSEYDRVYCLSRDGARKTVLCRKTKQKIPKYHSYRQIVEFLCNNVPPSLEKTRAQTSLTLPHLAMPKRYYPKEKYTSWDQAIQAYRAYYLDNKRFFVSGGKRREFTWTQGRSPPDFWIPTSQWKLSPETEEELCQEEKEQRARILTRQKSKNSKMRDESETESSDTSEESDDSENTESE